MKEKRFQVGDKVTYKDVNELPNKRYFYNGSNRRGYVGIISLYGLFIEEHNCYEIQVNTVSPSITDKYFCMLESEFEEYDVVQKEPNSKFNIGEVVNTTYEGYVYTDMDKHAYDSFYNWAVITRCNCNPFSKPNIVVKDKVYSSIQDKWWYKFDEFDNWVSECGVSSIIPIVDPMDAILEEAIRKYPIGTKYIPVNCSGVKYSNMSEFEVSYTPRIVHDHNYIDGGVGYLYAQGVWAEVVPETESVFKSPPTMQSVSSVTSSGTNPITLLSVTTPTIGTNPWGYTDSSALSPLSPKTTPFINPLPEPIQNTMPDEDIVHRENTIKAMQL